MSPPQAHFRSFSFCAIKFWKRFSLNSKTQAMIAHHKWCYTAKRKQWLQPNWSRANCRSHAVRLKSKGPSPASAPLWSSRQSGQLRRAPLPVSVWHWQHQNRRCERSQTKWGSCYTSRFAPHLFVHHVQRSSVLPMASHRWHRLKCHKKL